MNPNQSLLIQLVTPNGQPLELRGVAVYVQFFVKCASRYVFRAGKTDSCGQLRLTYKRIEHLRKEQGELALMDFNTPLEECDCRVRIELPTEEELAQRLQFSHQQHPLTAAPLSDFSTKLRRKVAPIEVVLEGKTTEIRIVCG